LKKSNRFEAEHLVTSFVEHTNEHLDISFLEVLLDLGVFAQKYRSENKRFPAAAEISAEFNDGTVGIFEEMMARTLLDFEEFFKNGKPEEMTRAQMKALKTRWGFVDGELHSLADVADETEEDLAALVILERTLLARAGWYVKEDKFTRRKWAKK